MKPGGRNGIFLPLNCKGKPPAKNTTHLPYPGVTNCSPSSSSRKSVRELVKANKCISLDSSLWLFANGHTLDLAKILPPVTADHRPLTAEMHRKSCFLRRSAVNDLRSGCPRVISVTNCGYVFYAHCLTPLKAKEADLWL